ncbi:DUF6877 family protein [Vagococcus intermedius]|nr:DUF6877 family protein [Vagococcus intermedius]WEG76516.1 hypothetical protein OL235_10720 [Vagococcus intermedius]
MKLENVMNRLNQIVSKYEFPPGVLEDVNERLYNSLDVNYHKQQVRYLENLIRAGLTTERVL